MQFRGLLIAVAALAVLGGLVWYSDKHKKDEEKAGSKDAPKIVAIPEDQVQQIEIRKKDGRNVVLKKTDKWQITAPEQLAVDQDAVTSMVSALGSISADRIVEEKAADLSTFGLTPPQVEVLVTKKDGKTLSLKMGDETATSGGIFAIVDGAPKVYTISGSNKSTFDKTTRELRDKRLVAFDSEKVSRVELATKGATLEFGKNSQNEWQMVKPKPMRADNWAVEELVRKIKEAKMDATTTDEDAVKATSGFMSGPKVATATITDAKGTHTIEVHKSDKDYFAQGSAIKGFYKVANDLGEGLSKGLDDFRNKKLFDFGFNDPTRVEVKGADGQTKVYSKSGDNWTRGSEKMDSISIQSFVDKLRDLSATKFLESGFGGQIFEVKLTARDGKIVDQVQIGKKGNDVVAIRATEPTVYQLDPNVVAELQKAADAIKAPAPEKKDEKKDEKKK